jgi:hypothetical protein
MTERESKDVNLVGVGRKGRITQNKERKIGTKGRSE